MPLWLPYFGFAVVTKSDMYNLELYLHCELSNQSFSKLKSVDRMEILCTNHKIMSVFYSI